MGTASQLKLQSLHRPMKMIKVALLLLPLIAAVFTAPEARFTCEECVREMHGLAAMVKMGAIPIHDYLRDNYCPTLESTAAQNFCESKIRINKLQRLGCIFSGGGEWEDCKALVE